MPTDILQTMTIRHTAKGRLVQRFLENAQPDELPRGSQIFNRTALSCPDVEFLWPILARTETVFTE